MVKITEVTASVAKTVQIKQYEPVKLFVSITYKADGEESLDHQKYFDEGLRLCGAEVNAKAARLLNK